MAIHFTIKSTTSHAVGNCNRCRVRYTTHAISGLPENNFICAAKIDALPAQP